MKIITPNYYKEFSCLAGNCPDTCCKAGWQIIIDDKTLEFYKNADGKIGEKLNKSILFSDKEYMFWADNGVCKFLRSDGLCQIQSEFGADRLCKTCRDYPRHISYYGGVKEIGIELSCPEAAKLILSCDKPIEFSTEQTDELPELTDVDAQLFLFLTKCREKSFEILHNRSISLETRIANLLIFNEKMQRKIKRKDYSNINFEIDTNAKIDLYLKAKDIKILRKCETLKAPWQEQLKEKQINFNNLENEFENILTYFIFRYYLNACYDKKVLRIVNFAIFSAMIIKYLFDENTDLIYSAKLYSREIEHSEINVNKLLKYLDKKRF